MQHLSGWTAPVLPQGHVARARLVRRIAEARTTVICANGGWGKSTLAAEVAAGHTGEVVWVTLAGPSIPDEAVVDRLLDAVGISDVNADPTGIPGVAQVMARRPATLVVVDDVPAAGWGPVATTAEALPPPHRLVGLGRHPPADGVLPGAVRLSTADLAFTDEEFLLLLGEEVPSGIPPVLARALRDAVGGWGTALRALASALGRSVAPVDLGRRLLHDNVVLADLIAELLTDIGDRDRAALRTASALPYLDRRLAEDMGLAEAIRRGQRLGLPWETPAVGPWTVPTPVADLLAADRGLPPEVIGSVTTAYAARGLPLHACRVALEHGAVELAASVLVDTPSHELALEHKPTVLALLESLGTTVVDRHPWLDVQVARLLTASARYAERNAFVLDRLASRPSADPAVIAALEAERFRDLAYFSATPDPADVSRINELLASAEDPGVRSRLEQGLALLQARADGVGAAEAGLRRAAEQAERAGETTQAVLALRDLAWVVLLEQGRLQEVIETFDRVEAMVGADSRTTAWRINRADTHLLLGDLAAAERDLDTALRLAELHHDEQHVAYAAWARATLESLRGRPLRVLAAVERAEAVAGSWIDTVTGVLFHAQAADALTRVGLPAEGRARLALARARREEDDRAVRLAELALEARLGDAAVALAIADDTAEDELEPFEVPRVRLLRALALHRTGQDATDAVSAAVVAYQAQGLLHTAPLWEPQACAALAAVARSAGAPLALGDATPGPPGAEPPAGASTDLGSVLVDRHGLSPREAEVLMALRTGGSNAEIADALEVSTATVRKHLQHAYATLGLRSRTEALVFLARMTGP